MQQPSRPAKLPSPTASGLLLLTLAALIIGVVVGYVLGQCNPSMHTTRARCLSAEGAISCIPVDDNGRVERDTDWTYGVPVDVAWTRGSNFHDGGRPGCLPPVGRGLSDVVQLSWVEVQAGGTGWRDVVSVGC